VDSYVVATTMRQTMLIYLKDASSLRNAYPAFWRPFALIGEGEPRLNFLIVQRSNFVPTWQRRMVAQPRRQTREKRHSIRLIQINRRRSNKPNRVDQLGKPGVHQY
jgi:hypothetical protein